MNLIDIANRTAFLTTLHEAIGNELKATKQELQTGLKAAKAETGTQQIGMTLDGHDLGKVTLVQPKAAAVVTDEAALLAWVRTVAKTEVTSRVVTEIRPAWLATLLKEVAAAGAPQWVDKDTGVVHDVPGVALQGRASYPRMTVSDDGKQLLEDALRSGALARMALPQLTTGGDQ